MFLHRALEGSLEIIGKVVLPDGSPIAGSHVSLNSGEYTVTSRIDGSFTFYDVASGTVICHLHLPPTLA